jgi:hypothetical protein
VIAISSRLPVASLRYREMNGIVAPSSSSSAAAPTWYGRSDNSEAILIICSWFNCQSLKYTSTRSGRTVCPSTTNISANALSFKHCEVLPDDFTFLSRTGSRISGVTAIWNTSLVRQRFNLRPVENTKILDYIPNNGIIFEQPPEIRVGFLRFGLSTSLMMPIAYSLTCRWFLRPKGKEYLIEQRQTRPEPGPR